MLDILKFPDPVLRERSLLIDVKTLDREYFDELVREMYLTMKEAKGCGLAAIQVGIPARLAVIDVDGYKKTLINPSIIDINRYSEVSEGCLSIPGVSEVINRPDTIKYQYQTIDGDWIIEYGEGLEAQAVAHEIDHMNGKLFFDHINSVKRIKLLHQYNKAK